VNRAAARVRSGGHDRLKRGMDVVLTAAGLVVLSPLLVAIAWRVFRELGRPIIFTQERPGLDGQLFKLRKFRTMTDERGPDGELLPDAARLTPFGRFLRSSSLDELPEMVNVLRGEMSLVGPRPLLVDYLDLYSPEQARRHLVRPGITGLAQVSGRNDMPWAEKFALDVWYVDHRSIWLDLRILLRTLWVMATREGVTLSGHATTMPFGSDDAPTLAEGPVTDSAHSEARTAPAPGARRARPMPRRPVVLHLTTVDMSLVLLLLPQLIAFRDAGYDVVGVSAPGPYVRTLEEHGIRHLPLHRSTRSSDLSADLATAREFARICRQLRPDIVHTHNPKPGVYGRLVARVCAVPGVVNTNHGLYAQPGDRLAKRVAVYVTERVAAAFSDAELVQNPEDLALLRRLGVPGDRLHLLGNGVDLSRFVPAPHGQGRREVVRSELGISAGEIVIGLVGRLVVEKGYRAVFEAAARLRTVRPQARFVVIGPREPDKADAISQAEIDHAAADAGVMFLGVRDDVERLYAAMDIYVLASHREGFPRSAMEAAAMGLPLVATDIRGCRQVVEDGLNGYLVPVHEPLSLARALTALVDDPDLRRQMGEASRRKALAEFDDRRQVRLTLETYRRVLSREAPLRRSRSA
jgi:lipopolysaccharide/colanic/teichoic acid biosynthesis glycosyltransferase/glycosyltransferase involved in cell wall biosynthesis